MKRFDIVDFISNVLSVILGIVVTFSIQAVTDRKQEKDNVTSALELVHQELQSSYNDIVSCTEFLKEEKKAAEYVLAHQEELHECPKDSITLYGKIIIARMILSVPDDALELLKTSSLFQAIGDNELSLKILKSYDQCDVLQQILSNHVNSKEEMLNRYIESRYNGTETDIQGNLSLTDLVHNKDGKRFLTMLLGQEYLIAVERDLPNVKEAIDAIESYLEKK